MIVLMGIFDRILDFIGLISVIYWTYRFASWAHARRAAKRAKETQG